MPSEDTQWKKGQSGNPGGRPVGSVSLVGVLKGLLDTDPARAKRLMDGLLLMAEGGDTLALKSLQTVIDRIDGGVTKRQEVNVTGMEKVKIVRLEGDDDDEEDEEEGSE